MTELEKPALWKWTDVWRHFNRDEQRDACVCLFSRMLDGTEEKWKRDALVRRLAKAAKFRPTAIEALLSANQVRLADMLLHRVTAVLSEELWRSLFASYFFLRKSALMCAFHDSVGVPHDEDGGVEAGVPGPAAEAVAAGVRALERVYAGAEIGRLLAVLARYDPERWKCVAEERDRLLAVAPAKIIEAADTERIAAVSEKFSVLDRLVIREIVRSLMGVEGALPEKELVELLSTVMRLNENWHRAYFHLGLMDVLLPTRELQFDRPEENDVRRGWYLAGAIAGLARTHASERLCEVLDARAADFQRIVGQDSGPGAAIARTGFRFLIEAGRLGEAIRLLEGQLESVGLELGEPALQVATEFIRVRRYADARKIVDLLRHHIPDHAGDDEDDTDTEQYKLGIERRFGQCLQAEGNFDAADRTFRILHKAGEDKSSPDLLADLGLVRGKFHSASDLRLPESQDQRRAVRDSLRNGEDLFRTAIERFGTATPKACYALAVLQYLLWFQHAEGKDREELRRVATDSVLNAIMAIQSAEFEHVYREIGALGQCQFMLAVLKMHCFDEVEGREAMAAWRGITGTAGKFPKADIRILLAAAEAHDAGFADEIAESVWEFRRDDAVEIIGNGPWVSRSPKLRMEILGLAKLEATPRAERLRLWCSVIPALNRSNEVRAAEDGLDELEALAEDSSLTPAVLDFVSVAENIDPAWRPAEAVWARIRLCRRLGKDEDCGYLLKDLFYMVRDSNPWEAEQILATFDDWKLDRALRDELAGLMPQRGAAGERGVEERLAAGERIRLVFVGGNETQARYDEELRRDLCGRWPGLDIAFEHTAWSSNWGRDLDRLTRLANGADAVVLMYMMRTLLGRRLREALEKPWIPCTSTGKGGMAISLRRAALVGLAQRQKRLNPG